MTKWKITRIYLIPAETLRAAQTLFANAVQSGKEDTYFDTEFIKRVEEHDQGWASAVKDQVFGTRK
jgi:hypothetical protein